MNTIALDLNLAPPEKSARLRQKDYEKQLLSQFWDAAGEILGKSGDGRQALDFVQWAENLGDTTGQSPAWEETVKQKFSSIDDAAVRLGIARILQIRGMAQQASWRLAYQRPDTPEERPYHFETMLRAAKEAGVTIRQVRRFFSTLWRNKAGTPHPTTYLSKKGLEFFLRLLGQNETMTGVNGLDTEAAYALFKDMLSSDETLVAGRPATTPEEIGQFRAYVERAHPARRRVFGAIKRAVWNVYGERLHFWGTHDNVRMATDFAERAWHGADTDGKPNVERLTFLVNWLGARLQKIDRMLADLADAKAQLPDTASFELRRRIDALTGSLAIFQQDTRSFFTREDALLSKIMAATTAQERLALFEANDATITQTLQQVRLRQRQVRIMGKLTGTEDSPNLHVAISGELQKIYRLMDNAEGHAEAQAIVDAMLDDTQDGLVSYRPEPRFNTAVLDKTTDNLFRHAPFLEHLAAQGVIAQRDIAKFLASGPECLDPVDEGELMRDIVRRIKTDKLKEFIVAANPPAYDERGFPVQSSELPRICDVMALSPFSYGPMVIIAEAHQRSVGRAALVLRSFGLDFLKPTPLLESLATLDASTDFVETAAAMAKHDAALKHNIAQLVDNHPELAVFLKEDVQTIMFARSDTGKESGPFSFMLGLRKAEANAYVSAVNGWAAGTQEGQAGPTALERGGGDPRLFLRVVGRAINRYQEKTGLRLHESATPLLMAGFLAYTRQGAALYETSGEIAADMQDQIAEMFGIRCELSGAFRKGSFILPESKLTEKALQVLDRAAAEAMHYYALRQKIVAGAGDDKSIYDRVAEEAGNPEIVALCNVSARPASKSANGKTPLKSLLRAIGVVLTGRSERTHEMGWVTAGRFLRNLQQACAENRLAPHDLQAFAQDPEWRDFLSRMLMSTAHVDFHHPLRRMMPELHVTNEQLLALGRSVRIETAGAKNVIRFDAGIVAGATGELAYLAETYRDYCDFLSLVENLYGNRFAETTFEADTAIAQLRGDESFNLRFGAQTLKQFPDIAEVARAEQQSRLSLVLTDFYEEAKRRGAPCAVEEMREAALTWRAQIAAHLAPVLKNRADTSPGHRREPARPGDFLPRPALQEIRAARCS